jgi:hypothetical protein
MSGERKIQMPIAVITDAKVIFEGQRKPRMIEVRADLVAEIGVIDAGEAPVAATAHLAAWLERGPGSAVRRAERIDYRGWNGRLWRKSVSRYNGPDKETLDIDEAMLRAITAAARGTKLLDNSLFARSSGNSPIEKFSYSRSKTRNDMPTLAEVAAEMPIREVVEDGIAAANRQVQRISRALVLIDGLLCQRTKGPLYAIVEPYGGSRQVIIPSGDTSDYRGDRLFGPTRADDAQDMCEWLSKIDRKGILPRHDVIEIVDPDLMVTDEAAIVVGNRFSDAWHDVGNLLHVLPAADLMRWARLRDLEVSVRNGHLENAVPAMVAFRDFIEGLKPLKFGGQYGEARERYFKIVRALIHRVCDIELPRLGIGPGDGALAPVDDRALDDIGAVPGLGDPS